jgi:hypothetical protein
MVFAEDVERPLSIKFGLGDVSGDGQNSRPNAERDAGAFIFCGVRAAGK